MAQRLEIMVQGDGAVTSHLFEDHNEVLVGRSGGSDLHLESATVSRRHAMFTLAENNWVLQDLDSSHGTWLNGRRIKKNEMARVGPGDVIQLRPWSLIVRKARSSIDSTVIDPTDGTLVRPRVEPLVKRRLDAFLGVVSAVQSLADEVAIADCLVSAVLDSANVDRAAIVQLDGDEIAAVAVSIRKSTSSIGAPSALSHTLVRAALESMEPIRLDEFPDAQGADSVLNAGLNQALCVPIDLGHGSTQALYADAWSGGLEDPELVAWCEALARLHAVSIGDRRREDAENERTRLFAEMESTRAAQELLLPGKLGFHGPYRWAVSAIPGLEVAGDLVDIGVMADGEIGLMVGDVSGKGARAGFVMASIQAYAHAVRDRGGAPEDLISSLDGWSESVVPDDVFITLWCARLDQNGGIRWIDAGHGMAYVVTSSGEVSRMAGPHRPPVGIEAIVAQPNSISLSPGDTLVLVTDGVVEQPNDSGAQFGEERMIACLSKSTDPDVLIEDVATWSKAKSFADDMTVVSVTFQG